MGRGLAEKCKATLMVTSWKPKSPRYAPQGDVQLMWESGQLLQEIGAKPGKEFVHLVFSDERTDTIEGAWERAFVSSPDGIQTPLLRAQDGFGEGEFEVKITVTSIQGTSVDKHFKIVTGRSWHDLKVEKLSMQK